MSLPSSIFAAILLFTLPSITIAQKDNGNECSCFRTNGSAYFTNHVFRDYRNIGGASSRVPALITDQDDSTNAQATSDYFLSEDWTDFWTTQNWNNSDTMVENSAPTFMINSPNNVYIESSKDKSPIYTSYLTLRTSRLPGFQTTAEINSNALSYHHISIRYHARVIGSPGACAGLFTYLPSNDPEKVQEGDIEILTQGPRNKVQYTNQPSDSAAGNDIPQATRNSTNPGERDWTLWNTYRYDWTKGMSAWYVNGESVANISFQAPRDPTQLMVNMWSDGGVWTGNMSLYDEAYLQIQWMQVVFNTSGPAGGSRNKKRDGVGAWGMLGKRERDEGCRVVCSVDEEVNTTGTPAVLYNNTGVAPAGWKGEGMGALVWLPLVLVGGAVFGYF